MQPPTLPPRTSSLKFTESVLFPVNAVVAFAGNLLVCLAVYRNASLRSTTNLYITALAISDILSALICQSLAIGVWITGEWPYGNVICNIYGFFAHFLIYVSVWTMTLTAVNRFFRVVKRGVYGRVFTQRVSLLLIGTLWLLAALIVLLPVLCGWGEFRFLSEFGGCGWYFFTEDMNTIFNSLQVVAFSVIPSIVIITCYIKVYRAIRAHNLNMAANFQGRLGGARITVEEIRITKTLSALVLGFALCWVPSFSIVLIVRLIISYTPHEVSFVASFLLALSSAINPFIYGVMNPSFRREFREILCCNGDARSDLQEPEPRFRFFTEEHAV